MSNSINHKIILVITSLSLVFSTSVNHADDTEIYFSSGSATESVLRPNVLFILDTSGSMSLDADSGQSRIDELKQAMETVLESLNDVNVGLMRFNFAGGQLGGPVIFPINYIDGDVSEVVGDSGVSVVTEIANTAFLESDSDDGEEVITTGEISLSDLTLDAFDFGGTQSLVGGEQTFPVTNDADDSMEENPFGCLSAPAGSTGPLNPNLIINCLDAGMRFTGITIPQGTTITSAFIDLVSRRNVTGTTNTTIVGQLIDDASVILAPSCPTCFCGINNPACLYFFSMFTSTFDITGRDETIASVAWNGVPVAATGVTLTSPDVSSIVQEIVDRPGWASGNDMFFRFQNASLSAYREF